MSWSIERYRGLPGREGQEEAAGARAGIVSDRDILRALSPFAGTATEREADAQTMVRKAHQVMKRHVVTVPADAPVAAAFLLMARMRVHCLPVMRGERLVGLITPTDLILAVCGGQGLLAREWKPKKE